MEQCQNIIFIVLITYLSSALIIHLANQWDCSGMNVKGDVLPNGCWVARTHEGLIRCEEKLRREYDYVLHVCAGLFVEPV